MLTMSIIVLGLAAIVYASLTPSFKDGMKGWGNDLMEKANQGHASTSGGQQR
jgi:hypothetical protein